MSTKPEIQMYLVVLEPPVGVTLAMQRGKDELLEPLEVTADALIFEFSLVVADLESGRPLVASVPLLTPWHLESQPLGV